MFCRTLSSTLIILFSGLMAVYADPQLLSEWQWNDPAGLIHEYKLFGDKGQSWEQANAQISEAWHLATITSAEEQQILVNGLVGLTGEFWLGGFQSARQEGPENDWAWVTGESWDYKTWAPGEPNDAWGSSSEQHIAVWSRWGTSNWLWNDEGHLPNIDGYIAERTTSAVPEPGQLSLFAAGLLGITCMIRIKKQWESHRG